MTDELMIKMLINDGAVMCICYMMMKMFSDRLDKINESINTLADKLSKRIDSLERDLNQLSFQMNNNRRSNQNG